MKNDPILYNSELPLAHYETARERYADVKKRLDRGIILPLVAFVCGALCVMYNPTLMAYFALFSIPFTLLSVIACTTRRFTPCMISVPMAFILALISVLTKEAWCIIGAAAYLAAGAAEIMALPAIQEFYKLKELPGFPFFDAAMDNITFAAMDRRGADEFIDESPIHEELEVKKYVPIEPPSQEMTEIITEGINLKTGEVPVLSEYEAETVKAVNDVPEELKNEVIMSLGHLAPNLSEYDEAAENEQPENADRPYEKMIMAQTNNKGDISDVDLFG